MATQPAATPKRRGRPRKNPAAAAAAAPARDKADSFKRVASRRTQDVLDKIDLLARTSNKATYKYEDADIEKIFAAIDERLKSARSSFQSGAPKGEGFTL